MWSLALQFVFALIWMNEVTGCWVPTSPGCVLGNNIGNAMPDKSIEQCKSLCLANPACVSFMYGADHGGSQIFFKSGDCLLNTGTDPTGCSGQDWNLDLYVKTECSNADVDPKRIDDLVGTWNVKWSVGSSSQYKINKEGVMTIIYATWGGLDIPTANIRPSDTALLPSSKWFMVKPLHYSHDWIYFHLEGDKLILVFFREGSSYTYKGVPEAISQDPTGTGEKAPPNPRQVILSGTDPFICSTNDKVNTCKYGPEGECSLNFPCLCAEGQWFEESMSLCVEDVDPRRMVLDSSRAILCHDQKCNKEAYPLCDGQSFTDFCKTFDGGDCSIGELCLCTEDKIWDVGNAACEVNPDNVPSTKPDPSSSEQETSGSNTWTPALPTMEVECRSSDYDITVTFPAAATDFEQLNEIKVAGGAIQGTTANTCTTEDIQVTGTEVERVVTNIYGTSTKPGCGTGAQFLDDDPTKIEYTTGVLVTIRQRKDKLQRYYNYQFEVKCTLDRDGKVKSEQTFSVVNSEPENAVAEEESGTFVLGVAMNFLKKDSEEAQEATFQVKNNELLRVSVKETAVGANNQDPDLKFTVQKCFVSNKPTADDNAADTVKADIIDNECGIDDTIKLTPGGNDQSEFKFEARAFSLVTSNIDDKLSIHCEIFVCRTDENENDHGGKCVQGCKTGQRRRRDLVGETNDAERKEIVSSSQTFAFTDHVFSTQCPPGFVFDRLAEKCTQQRLVLVKGIHLKGQWVDSYANSSSPSFRSFARSTEHQLHALMTATGNQEEITGMAITDAKQGSLPGRIVIDMLISHTVDVQPEEAFSTLKKVLYRTSPQVTRLVNLVNVDRDKVVDLVHVGLGGATGLDVNVLVIVIVVVVMAVVLVGGVVSYQMVKKQRSSVPVTKGVDNVAMEKG